MKLKKIRNYILSLSFLLVNGFSLANSSFVLYENAEEKIININEGSSAVCYTKSDNQLYTTIEKAVEVANNRQNESVIVNLGSTCNITKDIIIKNTTSLIISHNENLETYSFQSKGTPLRKSLINLNNGADITIESGGTLILGGTIGTRGINGDYSQIALGLDSTIKIYGNAYIYGKVTETNPIYGNKNNNIVYDNSLDSNRLIHVYSTGMVETAFASYDMGSGSTLLNNINNNICPTYKFNFNNLQTYTRVDKGGIINVMAYVSISGTEKNALCGLVSPQSESTKQSLFYISEGSVSFEYCSAYKTLIYIDGKLLIGALYIDVGLEQIDSKKFDLPISSYLDIYINGTFDTNSKSVKFLPGSNLTIGESSTLLINGTSSSASKTLFYEANSLKAIGISGFGDINSKVVNNGNIIVNEYAAIAGYIETKNTLGTSTIDLSKLSDPNNLNFSMREGDKGEKNIPSLRLQGTFYDQNNAENETRPSFFEPSTLYTSHVGLPCYDGLVIKIQNINIRVNTEQNFKYNAYEYTLYTNTEPSDTGAKALFTKVNTVLNNNIELEKGNYIKIVDNKCERITINGNPYTLGQWIQIEEDINIDIIPKQSFAITCKHTNGTSGAGEIQRSIIYGVDSTNMSFSVDTSTGDPITAIIPEGWKFKVKDDSSVHGVSKVVKTTYASDGSKTETVLATKSGGLAWDQNTIYTSDANYLFTSDNVNCIAEGTLILMSDNTQKKVEDLRIGDLVKVFNHETGKIDESPIIFITHKDEKEINTDVINLKFNNGFNLEIINDHALFDRNTNQYEVINKDNLSNYIGHEFAFNNNDSIVFSKLKTYEIENKTLKLYCPVTAFHMNLFANNILTMPTFPNDIRGLYNIFELDTFMKYDEERKNIDISTYGLFTYEEFCKIIEIPFEAFNASPAIYLKISLGKGLITEEEIICGIKFLLSNSLI